MSSSREKWTPTAAKELERLTKKSIREDLTIEEHATLQKRQEQQRDAAEGKIILKKSCRDFLRGIYLRRVYGVRYELIEQRITAGVPQLVRGIKTEADATLLMSQVDGKPYYKHQKQIENDYLTGKLDVLDAKNLKSATRIIDIKTCDDIERFFEKPDAPFTTDNMLQMQGYLAITDKKVAELAHVLIGYSEDTIREQKQLLFEKMCPDGVETPEFTKKWEKAESDMRFADIPQEARIFSYEVYRDEEMIENIYGHVKACRVWLNEYHEEHKSLINKRYLE
jgi:hypothetical protein